ncbi:hypothetical protein AALO_G00024080 [Alosa alosa]|uniref:Uncharacterized protein n=1 Tax=Alosa alosa TaxID=278164 RepID=A0AAV6HAD8_9TELE|nr:hypothetical protein AALO_G00024080 [Alosa alosa]
MTGQGVANRSLSAHRLSVRSTLEDDQDGADSTISRSQSVCDDTSSELERVAALDPQAASRNSFRGRGALSRLVTLVVTLRDWAHRSLIEEEERPDSFLERFRGPELRPPPSRFSNTQTDANGNMDKAIKKKRETFVISPSDDMHYRWLFVIGGAVLYNWVLLVARACFDQLQTQNFIMWLVLDYLCDSIYILDTIYDLTKHGPSAVEPAWKPTNQNHPPPCNAWKRQRGKPPNTADIASLLQAGYQQRQQFQQQQQQLAMIIQLLSNLSSLPAPTAQPQPACSPPSTRVSCPVHCCPWLRAPEPRIGNPERFSGGNQVAGRSWRAAVSSLPCNPGLLPLKGRRVGYVITHLAGRARLWERAEFAARPQHVQPSTYSQRRCSRY